MIPWPLGRRCRPLPKKRPGRRSRRPRTPGTPDPERVTGGYSVRSYGNELWEFDADGHMRRREASINDVPIAEAGRRIFGPRPEAERGQSFPLR